MFFLTKSCLEIADKYIQRKLKKKKKPNHKLVSYKKTQLSIICLLFFDY